MMSILRISTYLGINGYYIKKDNMINNINQMIFLASWVRVWTLPFYHTSQLLVLISATTCVGKFHVTHISDKAISFIYIETTMNESCMMVLEKNLKLLQLNLENLHIPDFMVTLNIPSAGYTHTHTHTRAHTHTQDVYKRQH